MSSFPLPNGDPGTGSITLTDEAGRSLDCYIEQVFDSEGITYLLLQPVDSPVTFIAWDDEDESSEATWVEDITELEKIYGDAKAVLGEQNLTLQATAYTFTVAGELPPIEEEDVLAIEMDEDDPLAEPEEFQYLANFFHEGQEYGIYTPLTPLLFFAKQVSPDEQLQLLSPEELETIQPWLEEFLFNELE
jgi:hypothetical protein